MRDEPECPRTDPLPPQIADRESAAWLQRLRQQSDLPEREFRLYVRYLRALALLCECAPYVDEDDYLELVDELLADAAANYPIEIHRDDNCRQIAPRAASIARRAGK
jgi:hypothetical protein